MPFPQPYLIESIAAIVEIMPVVELMKHNRVKVSLIWTEADLLPVFGFPCDLLDLIRLGWEPLNLKPFLWTFQLLVAENVRSTFSTVEIVVPQTTVAFVSQHDQEQCNQ